MAAMAGCGLPGFANFPGELLVMFGAWKASFGHAQWFVVAAAWGGLVIGAIYMLRAVRSVLHGELSEKWNDVQDAMLWRKTPFVLLLAALIWAIVDIERALWLECAWLVGCRMPGPGQSWTGNEWCWLWGPETPHWPYMDLWSAWPWYVVRPC
jgi:NADH:ubiquinone oxidoreductase subunit 5 (subunit L)/multisubunit Na+/H+ antiporter MnhA subunit